MKKNKKSLQELILETLSLKRARKHEDIVDSVEIFIKENDTTERKVKPQYLINRAINTMINENIVTQHSTEQSSFLSLTPEGRKKLRTLKLSSSNHLLPITWDGYWRMVIVDIHESQKKDQDAFRYILKKAQFVQIKKSLWISPYPLEHLIIGMKQDMNLDDEIMVLVSNKLDTATEELLMKKFTEKKEG